MAPSKKTQQQSAKNSPELPDPEAIARHFMTLWQQQWQDYLNHAPTLPSDLQAFWTRSMAPGGMPFGFGGNFGQNNPHGDPTTTQSPAQLAAAALAASGQCLELLKQFSERLDDVATRVDAITKPKSTAKDKAKPAKKSVKRR